MSKVWSISVPGSTANLGPGFDSIGLALGLYLKLDVSLQEKWSFVHHSEHLPAEVIVEEHLIYKVAQQVAAQYEVALPTCKVEMYSELPLARGLGSSASAIVAAIELVNVVCDLQLSAYDKCVLASEIEGHPDNASASVCGGLTIGATLPNGELHLLNEKNLDACFAVFIPDVELKTSEARKALPNSYDKAYAVHGSSYANLLTAALLKHDYALAGKFMEADLFHEPFRAKLIPNYELIRKLAKDYGAYGTAISGAGPTVISLIHPSKVANFVKTMQQHLPSYDIKAVSIDSLGVQTTVHTTNTSAK
ncbi:MAG: homoserine kinase [Kurthia sp.]|nr:homoserine kinase [Candidatus Kurthia equi]